MTPLEYALSYAQRGWPVFPLHTPEADGRCSCRNSSCASIGKHPRTMNGLTGASTDQAQITNWWETWPGANIGLVTGARSGIVALDIDPRHDGDSTLGDLIAYYGELPPTLESLTGSGGRHLLFKFVAGMRNTAGQAGPGIDSRAEGGYIVAPPSVHASGRRYEWELDSTDKLAELPSWLLELLSPKGKTHAPAEPVADQINEGGRNQALMSIAGTLRRRGMDDEEIFASLAAVNARRCVPALAEDELRKIAKSASRYPPKAPVFTIVSSDGSEQTVSAPATRPVLELGPDEHELNQQAIAALATHPEVYQRTGTLVRVSRESNASKALNRQPNAPLITPLPQAVLRSHLTQVADFKKYSKSLDKLVPDHPWDFLVRAVHEYGEWPGLRSLEAVAESPLLRPDGTVITEPGYDADTGVLFVPNCEVPTLPARPTHDDAMAAAVDLLAVVDDFPFATAAHRSAWLAALLTPLCRKAISSPAPIFAVDANVRGSGKSLLTDTIALMLTVRRMARMIYSADDDEMRKRITAIAMEGDPLVLIDNIAGQFGGPALDGALTSLLWSDRLLGSNKIVRVPLVATWFATGNNLQFQGDLARRTLHIRLESREEKPEEREDFQHPDLLKWVGDERPRLLASALTILRAFCVAGRPNQKLRPWGSFESWSDLVRGAIVWCGLDDPGSTRVALAQSADAEANGLAALIAGWRQLDSAGEGVSCADALRRLDDCPRAYDTLRTAILELCPTRTGGLPSAKSLGYTLRKFKHRVVAGSALDQRLDRNGIACWLVSSAQAANQTAGDAGDARGI